MKANLKFLSLLTLALMCSWAASAQNPPTENPSENPEQNAGYTTESGNIDKPSPRDHVYDQHIIEERGILNYDHIREADVLWEKRIWRIIDVREKMNLPFSYPEQPFIKILLTAAENNDIDVYSTTDDKFTSRFTEEEMAQLGGTVDTIITFDPVTYEEKQEIVRNDLNPEDIKRFRLKEVWFFDEETSSLQVRILGIAPIRDKYDNEGNFLFEFPMFWAYYPQLRPILAQHKAFNELNPSSNRSWENIFEMRFFSSYIIKESNVHDNRIKDYKTAPGDILREAERIEQSIFNFEHDLWSY